MDSDKNVLIVIAPKDYREEEYETPKRILEENGITVSTASTAGGECFGVGGGLASADIPVSEVNVTNYDAVLFVGGPGVELMFADNAVLKLVQDFNAAGKVVGAICWAVVILARAGLIKDKKVTGWQGGKEEIEKAGANYSGESVTIDGNLITAEGPESAEPFTQSIIDLMQNI